MYSVSHLSSSNEPNAFFFVLVRDALPVVFRFFDVNWVQHFKSALSLFCLFFFCFLSTVATLCFLRKYLFTMYRGCYVKICAIMLTSHPYKLQDIPSIPGDLLITFILSISNTWGYIILTASLLDKRVKLNELFSSCSVPCSLSLVNKFLKPPTECFA